VFLETFGERGLTWLSQWSCVIVVGLSVMLQVDTIPQGVVDMNQCTDVRCAEVETGHQFSIAVVTSKGTTYIKGSSREEISRYESQFIACIQ